MDYKRLCKRLIIALRAEREAREYEEAYHDEEVARLRAKIRESYEEAEYEYRR